MEDPPRESLSYLFCQRCLSRRMIAMDKNSSAPIARSVIKWCVEKNVPFMPVDFSTPSWKDWIKRVPYCIRFQSASRTSKADREFTACEEQTEDSISAIAKELSARDDIVYMVPTSGTTKPIPKLVYVTKASVEPNISDFINKLAITGDSVLYCSSPLTFDPAILTVLLSIRTGAKLVLYNDMGDDSIQLLRRLKDAQVTHIQAVPSFLRLLQLRQIASQLLTSDTCVQVIAMGGEPCLTGDELYTMCGGSDEVMRKVKVFSLYGLTEQSVWSAMHQLQPEYMISKSVTPVPIGDPLTDTAFVFKPASFEDTDVESTAGTSELILRSEKRSCYIDDGEGIVKSSTDLPTGDLVTEDVVFLGRKVLDFVKVGAARISLIALTQEVERSAGVQQAYCCHRPSVGLVVMYTGDVETTNVESFLQTSDMCAGGVTVMKAEELKVNSHGKLDRKSLNELIDTRLKEKTSKSLDVIKIYLPGDLKMSRTFTENGGSSIQALALSNRLSLMTSQTNYVVLEDILNRSIGDLCRLIDRGKRTAKGTDIDLRYSLADDFIAAKRYKIRGSFLSRSRDTVKLSKPVDVLMVMWTVDTGKCVDASPVMAVRSHGDVILIGSHSHKFMCINTVSGGVVWTAQLAGRIEARAAVDEQHGKVYVGCYDKNLYCINLTSGAVEHKEVSDDVIKSTPAIDTVTKSVYFGSHDHCVYCLDGDSFRRQWKQVLDGAIYTTPVLSNDSVYIATLAGTTYTIDKVSGDTTDTVSQGAPIFSTPVLTDAGIVVCSVDGLCLCRDKSRLSSVIWSFKAESKIFSTPAVIDGCLVFGCHDNKVYCVNAGSGEMKWRSDCDSPVNCTPFSYKVNRNTYVVITSTGGSVYAVAMATGNSSRVHRLPGEVFGSPVLMGCKLFIGCRDDKVYCLHYDRYKLATQLTHFPSTSK